MKTCNGCAGDKDFGCEPCLNGEHSGDLISRNALKEEIIKWFNLTEVHNQYWWNRVKTIIDNAPTIETYTEEDTEEDIKDAIKIGFRDGYAMARAKYESSQDEVILAHEQISYERGVADGYAEAIEERLQGDLISRESARMCLTGVIEDDMTISDFICRTDKRLREIPACEERLQSKWTIIDDTTCECPKCKHQQVYVLSPKESNVNFCENCGADNRGGSNGSR